MLSGMTLIWFGHLQCMDEEKWPRKILNFEVKVAALTAAQRKVGLSTLDVTLINCVHNFFGTRWC